MVIVQLHGLCVFYTQMSSIAIPHRVGGRVRKYSNAGYPTHRVVIPHKDRPHCTLYPRLFSYIVTLYLESGLDGII